MRDVMTDVWTIGLGEIGEALSLGERGKYSRVAGTVLGFDDFFFEKGMKDFSFHDGLEWPVVEDDMHVRVVYFEGGRSVRFAKEWVK